MVIGSVSAPSPLLLGTINGYTHSTFYWQGHAHPYNGTTLGLVRAALKAGALPGDPVRTSFGIQYIITPDGGGTRTPNGVWARHQALGGVQG